MRESVCVCLCVGGERRGLEGGYRLSLPAAISAVCVCVCGGRVKGRVRGS